ncbi:hypothetical protein AUEXF2481DRAFT_30335 [Aureobasidium subglaciale EXF-2481]|uniref:Uncharacterized protein n=1 Tax=Aureobasidium subglaciale (strain EXF-2481) TaxID=1043005 RepID=A0A074YE72_AURSE|nr:uncharacterized protein AUEXF2481DRAFT_30335 [Aureobasidium subglaciale EXF-2481]KAI5209837.1 hypothetical protein E4T38_02249 [Aureobasidium subglaciale]KAI5228516.1 hypothetical protein E4T40_02028 [Aureobasidium subglaciale]KAI5231870.1 hypothetical protein E4T41_02248 [Aureobasidium subglaciale]KAI5265809.1 hypothetical protein E4T46_02026 [Aureobasidium subglaciale]KEQ94359.1 hypothetical protein AUEXF2481DRAFT_30335 [Aureobasidium subglaciale EXF-2481]
MDGVNVNARDQWALLALANEAMQFSVNSTADGTKKDSNGVDWLMVVKGLLPMITLALGFGGRTLMDHFFLVMTTLAEVEAPIAGGVDSADSGSEKYGLLEGSNYKDKARPSVSVGPRYVTSSLRATIRHLNAEAGDLSMFRGIGAKAFIYILMVPVAFVSEFVAGYLPYVKSGHISGSIAELIAALIACQLWAGLMHIIISKPRNKFWFRRLPLSFIGVLRHAWFAIIVNNLSDDLLEWAIRYFTSFSKSKVPKVEHVELDNTKPFQLSQGPIVEISIAIVLWMFAKSLLRSQIKPLIKIAVLKPVQAIEGRVMSSMLRDDEDPVVPMDRSFQGRPQSGGILQQQPEPLDFTAAARTIDKETYLRLVKLEVKMHFISQFVQWAFWTLIFAEVVYFIGPSSVWLVLKLISGTPITQADLNRTTGNMARGLFEKVIAAPGNFTVTTVNTTSSPLSLDQ